MGQRSFSSGLNRFVEHILALRSVLAGSVWRVIVRTSTYKALETQREQCDHDDVHRPHRDRPRTGCIFFVAAPSSPAPNTPGPAQLSIRSQEIARLDPRCTEGGRSESPIVTVAHPCQDNAARPIFGGRSRSAGAASDQAQRGGHASSPCRPETRPQTGERYLHGFERRAERAARDGDPSRRESATRKRAYRRAGLAAWRARCAAGNSARGWATPPSTFGARRAASGGSARSPPRRTPPPCSRQARLRGRPSSERPILKPGKITGQGRGASHMTILRSPWPLILPGPIFAPVGRMPGLDHGRTTQGRATSSARRRIKLTAAARIGSAGPFPGHPGCSCRDAAQLPLALDAGSYDNAVEGGGGMGIRLG